MYIQFSSLLVWWIRCRESSIRWTASRSGWLSPMLPAARSLWSSRLQYSAKVSSTSPSWLANCCLAMLTRSESSSGWESGKPLARSPRTSLSVTRMSATWALISAAKGSSLTRQESVFTSVR